MLMSGNCRSQQLWAAVDNGIGWIRRNDLPIRLVRYYVVRDRHPLPAECQYPSWHGPPSSDFEAPYHSPISLAQSLRLRKKTARAPHVADFGRGGGSQFHIVWISNHRHPLQV